MLTSVDQWFSNLWICSVKHKENYCTRKCCRLKFINLLLKQVVRRQVIFIYSSTLRTFFYIGKLTLDLIIIGLLETFQKFRKFSDDDPVHFKFNNPWLITIRLHLIFHSFSKHKQSNRSWSYHFTFYICHTAWLWAIPPEDSGINKTT